MNPIFLRFCRSELRVRKAIFWYLLTLIVTAFTVAMIYLPQVVREVDPVTAARDALLPILIIQGIILIFMGTGSVASGITREKVDNVLNYQRLTPLSIRDKIIGYVFGLPVREYVLFGITLPFLAFVLIVGKVPPSAFIPYYCVFFSSTLLYHFTGLVAGMISKRWRWSARISQGLIIMLYFALPQLSHVGLVFLEFLTVRPVFTEHILPIVGRSENIQVGEIGMLSGQDVPFYTFLISGTVFSLLIQSFLILLFILIVARKWKADAVPAFSKRMAVGTFLVFAIMSLGNIWPNLVQSENALSIFQSNGDLAAELAVLALPLTLALVTTILGIALLGSALPDPLQYRHGLIRARRLDRDHLSPWEDAASGILTTSLLGFIQAILLAIALITLNSSGYFDELPTSATYGLFLIATSLLCLFYFQGLKETFGSGQLGLFALLHWMVPILVAVLIFAIRNELGGTALIVAAASPVTVIPLSAIMVLPPDRFDDHIIHIHRALGFGLLLLTTLTVVLHARLRRSRRTALQD